MFAKKDLNLSKNQVKNFFNLDLKTFASENELKNFKFFNLGGYFKIRFIGYKYENICPNCQEEIKTKWNYCPDCGEELSFDGERLQKRFPTLKLAKQYIKKNYSFLENGEIEIKYYFSLLMNG